MKKLVLCVLILSALMLASCSFWADPAEIYLNSTGISYMSDDTYAVTWAENISTEVISDAVYFTDAGSVYHKDPGCSSLANSSEILSGTVEYAVELGKSRLCSRCGS